MFIFVFVNNKTKEVGFNEFQTLKEALTEMEDYTKHYPDDKFFIAVKIT